MKKIFAALLSTVMLTAAFAGCNAKEVIVEKEVIKTEYEYIPYTDYSGNEGYMYSNLFYEENGPYLGDPFLFYDEPNEIFYLYGTTRGYTGRDAFSFFYSYDLVNWEFGGDCFVPTADDWCHNRLWAPELYEIDGKYYLYYTGAANSSAPLHGSVAVADSPEGPFSNYIDETCDGSKPVFDFGNNFPTIDGSLFIDDDGSMYYYFARDQIGDNSSSGGTNSETRSTIWGIEMENPYTILPGATPVKLTEVGKSTVDEAGYSQAWERTQGRWNEGPFMLKHDGMYYLTYSANYWGSKYYAVGVAVSDEPLNNFIKDENALVMGVDTQGNDWSYFLGSGHHMFITIGDQDYIVYHKLIANSNNTRNFAMDTYGFREDGTLYINGPTINYQPLPTVVSNLYNAAGEAEMTVTGEGSGESFLTDGAVNVYKKFVGNEFTFEDEVTITFTFPQNIKARGVIVYDSAEYTKKTGKIAEVAFGDIFTARNIGLQSGSQNVRGEMMYAGGCAALTLDKAISTNVITVKLEATGTANIAEIYIMAEKA